MWKTLYEADCKQVLPYNSFLEVPVCYVQTEHNRLSQVLINLLVNAAKFTEKGEIMFGYKIRGEELYFYVKDTGIGISLENQKKIFERFTKVNTFIQGTGLGLSICKNIVTKMKGRIGVESEGEGKGSTFWFTIPYKPKEAQKENNLTLMPLLNERSKEKPIIPDSRGQRKQLYAVQVYPTERL
ncbi:ATP-binding protein [Bacteroides uniformis]|nr:ATP-binding protein [Bacteroides uniformis]